jgi:hypothetical protein
MVSFGISMRPGMMLSFVRTARIRFPTGAPAGSGSVRCASRSHAITMPVPIEMKRLRAFFADSSPFE